MSILVIIVIISVYIVLTSKHISNIQIAVSKQKLTYLTSSSCVSSSINYLSKQDHDT